MSNAIKIVAHIRLAVKSDLFLSPKEYLKPNVVYFVFSEKEQKVCRTDVTTKEDYNSFLHQELAELFIFQHIYVLDEKQSGIPVVLPLKPAVPEDLKFRHLGITALRENYQYYIKENSEEVLGPFILNSKTNLYRIKSLLNSSKIYKVFCDEEVKTLKS